MEVYWTGWWQLETEAVLEGWGLLGPWAVTEAWRSLDPRIMAVRYWMLDSGAVRWARVLLPGNNTGHWVVYICICTLQKSIVPSCAFKT